MSDNICPECKKGCNNCYKTGLANGRGESQARIDELEARNAKLEAGLQADKAYHQARNEFNIKGNEHTARILSEAIATHRAALDALDD